MHLHVLRLCSQESANDCISKSLSTPTASMASGATTRSKDVASPVRRFRVRHTLAEMGATRLWQLLKTEPFVPTLGALTGNEAVQQVKAGLQAIYLSGWQVAGDAKPPARCIRISRCIRSTRCLMWSGGINNALRRYRSDRTCGG